METTALVVLAVEATSAVAAQRCSSTPTCYLCWEDPAEAFFEVAGTLVMIQQFK